MGLGICSPTVILFILITVNAHDRFRNTVDFHPVPAAGTYVDESGSFVCSMGLVECMGHKWMSCAIDLFPKVDELIEHLAVRIIFGCAAS